MLENLRALIILSLIIATPAVVAYWLVAAMVWLFRDERAGIGMLVLLGLVLVALLV